MASPRNVTYNQNSDTTNSQEAQRQKRKTDKQEIAHLSCGAKTTPEFQQVPAKQQEGPERKTPRIGLPNKRNLLLGGYSRIESKQECGCNKYYE